MNLIRRPNYRPAPLAVGVRAERRQQIPRQAGRKKSTLLSPGSLVKIVLDRIGYKAHGSCGCASFARWMNDIGWKGCWKHRRTIVKWFQIKAREAGIPLKDEEVLTLLIAGARDVWIRSGWWPIKSAIRRIFDPKANCPINPGRRKQDRKCECAAFARRSEKR